MKNVAILTTFRADDPAYSLCNVTNDQLKMLIGAGYKPVVLVTKGFVPGRMFKSSYVELRELPDQTRSNAIDQNLIKDEAFMKDVQVLQDAMVNALRDVDVVITHDIIYQPDALKHRIALAYAHDQAMPHLRFMHWIHSATSPYRMAALRGQFPEAYREAMKDVFPNSFYIFMNEFSRPRIGREFGVPEHNIRIIPHPTDYFNFAKYDKETIKLIHDKKLHEADYVAVYPIRLDRGKQVEVVIKIMATLKKLDRTVRVVIVDFHSNSKDPSDPKYQYRQELREVAIDWGLNSEEITFTSEYLPEWDLEVPSTVIADLFDISNLFIMPSASESFSLITQEAAMKNNLLVLNRNFPPFREMFGPAAIHWPFNSAMNPIDITEGKTTVNFKSPEHEKEDYMLLAKNILASTLNKQNITRRGLLKLRTLESVFRHQFEPTMFDLFNVFPIK
jgi:glycosyltransferase involved in cell wall biosynthesis